MSALPTKIENRAFQIRWYDQHDWLCAIKVVHLKDFTVGLVYFFNLDKISPGLMVDIYNNFKNILSDVSK